MARAVPKTIKEKKGTKNVTRERRSKQDPNGDYLEDIAPMILRDDARDIWSDLFPRINNLQIMREEDKIQFATMCNHIAVYRDALKSYEDGGKQPVVRDLKGGSKENPALGIMRRESKSFTDLAKLFHIMPIPRAQANLQLPIGKGKKDEDQFDDI